MNSSVPPGKSGIVDVTSFIKNKQPICLTLLENGKELNISTINNNTLEVHVGQVTTRMLANGPNGWATPLLSARQGMPWVRIHNATGIPLYLNNNIRIGAFSSTVYRGREHYGVPMGLILKDQDKRFDDFQMLHPVTDIYYGLPTATPQAVYGGYQIVWAEESKESLQEYF